MRTLIDFCDVCKRGKISSSFAVRKIFSIKSDVYNPIIEPTQYELCNECYKDLKRYFNKKGIRI